MNKEIFKLLKGGYCYSPDYLGKKDILIVGEKIYKIDDSISPEGLISIEIIDCKDKIVCPGFIDQHVHITGGGGENGPSSLITEISAEDILAAGVTTVVGLLGFDAISKNMEGLLAKARALNNEGITAYIYTGNYGVPVKTLTEKISTDIVYVNEIIGVGEIAISDHRSSQPSTGMLKETAYEARLGGMVSGKAGVVHIHIGDGKGGLKPLIELLDSSDFPKDMFVPTHVNRNERLFIEAIEYNRGGGNIDLTAGESEQGVTVPEALYRLKNINEFERITVSSDGNGSIPPKGNGKPGVGKVKELYTDIINSVLDKKLELNQVLKTVTINPAKLLKIFPQKGVIQEGSDADLLIIDKDKLSINRLVVRGKIIEYVEITNRNTLEDPDGRKG